VAEQDLEVSSQAPNFFNHFTQDLRTFYDSLGA